MAKILPLPITQNASTSASATLQSAAAATGNGTSLAVLGMSSAALTVSGTFVGTLIFEGTEDNSNWTTLNVRQFGTTNVFTAITALGTYEVSCSGLQNVRARISAYTSGAITVTGHTVPMSSEIGVLSSTLKIFSDVWDSVTHAFKTKEQYAPGAEDNVNNVIGVIQKPVVASQYSPILSTTAITPATKKAAKNFPGQLLGIYATNTNAAVRYLLIHDKGSTPAGGDVPVLAYPIPAGTAAVPGSVRLGSNDWTENGLSMSNGVSYAISTTAASFTDSATAAEHIVNAMYI